MRKQITFIVIVLLVIAILATAAVAIHESKTMSRTLTRDHVTALTDYVAKAYTPETSWEALAGPMLDEWSARNIPLRLTVITTHGVVLYDSAAKDLENHLSRPEILSVIADGRPAEATRYSQTLKSDLYYYATPVPNTDLILRAAYPLTLEDQTMRTVRARVLLISTVSIVVMGLLLAFVITKVTRPLETMTDSFEALALGGDAEEVHVKHQAYPEIRRLASSYNHMAKTIETQQSTLLQKQSFLDALVDHLTTPLVVIDERADVILINEIGMETFRRYINPTENPYPLYLLTHDQTITEHAKALIHNRTTESSMMKTLETNDGLKSFRLTMSPLHGDRLAILFHDRTAEEQAAQLRSEFVANVTHELRTPLTSIRGMIDTLRSGKVREQDQAQRFLQLMDIESARLERLVSDLLVLSNLEQSDGGGHDQPFDLAELASEVASGLRPLADERDIELRHPTEPLIVCADRDRIKQLLLNLVDNGIKYNRPGGFVEISWSTVTDEHGTELTIAVRDNGEGIPAADQNRIFERFYRVDRSRAKAPRGTGLGLAIVKHIALLYDGRVHVTSDVGIGTTITIHLKLRTR